MPSDPFAPPAPEAVVVGTGRLTLDVIVRSGEPATPRSQAGGTCGNVLANLAYLGWQAFPLTDLGDDEAGRRFCNDLQRWGTHLDLIRLLPAEQTPVIIHHIRETDGGAVHSFSSRCPFCGQRLRYYEPLPVGSVRERLPLVPDARACFFDRDSEGALLLGRHCAEKGALVVFEPNYAGKETPFASILPRVHVLKFARDKLPDLEKHFALFEPLLVVETLGAEGLNYRDQRAGPGEWRHLPSLPAPAVRDAGGSGDWCTAGLIHLLGRRGLAGFRAASDDELVAALRFGQALAAWNCSFEGARGAVYSSDKPSLQQAVRRILQGQSVEPPHGEPAFDLAGDFCPRCHGTPPEEGNSA